MTNGMKKTMSRSIEVGKYIISHESSIISYYCFLKYYNNEIPLYQYYIFFEWQCIEGNFIHFHENKQVSFATKVMTLVEELQVDAKRLSFIICTEYKSLVLFLVIHG